jgi:hypothetical protein
MTNPHTPRFVGALALTLFAALPGVAANIPIVNFSFENPDAGTNPNNNFAAVDNVPGWTATGRAQIADVTGYTQAAPDGHQSLQMIAGHIDQTLTTHLTANTLYTLSYYIASRNQQLTSDYTLAPEAGNTVLASDSNFYTSSTAYSVHSFTFNSGATPAQVGQALQVVLDTSGFNTPSNNSGLTVFDDISLSAVSTSGTPEPASFALLSTGLAALGLFGRKRLT